MERGDVSVDELKIERSFCWAASAKRLFHFATNCARSSGAGSSAKTLEAPPLAARSSFVTSDSDCSDPRPNGTGGGFWDSKAHSSQAGPTSLGRRTNQRLHETEKSLSSQTVTRNPANSSQCDRGSTNGSEELNTSE